MKGDIIRVERAEELEEKLEVENEKDQDKVQLSQCLRQPPHTI